MCNTASDVLSSEADVIYIKMDLDLKLDSTINMQPPGTSSRCHYFLIKPKAANYTMELPF